MKLKMRCQTRKKDENPNDLNDQSTEIFGLVRGGFGLVLDRKSIRNTVGLNPAVSGHLRDDFGHVRDRDLCISGLYETSRPCTRCAGHIQGRNKPERNSWRPQWRQLRLTVATSYETGRHGRTRPKPHIAPHPFLVAFRCLISLRMSLSLLHHS